MNKKLRIILVLLILGIMILSVISTTHIIKNSAYSKNYNAIETQTINVSLMENEEIKNGESLLNLEDRNLIPGKTYPEEIAVYNSGAIDEYVRVVIYKYFEDSNGNKVQYVSPELINLNYCKDSRWIVDERASTAERTVLYYIKQLPSGGKTPNLMDSFKIESSVLDAVNFTSQTTSDGKTIITSSKEYEGLEVCINIEVDATQTHNANDAILSAWGVEVDVAADGTISLK